MRNLEESRKEIDDIDGQLVQLLKRRLAIAGDVLQAKVEKGLPILDPAREREVMARVAEEVGPGMEDEARLVFTTLFGISRAAFGNRNHIRLEVYGDRGGLRFDLNDVTHIEIGTEARSDMRFEEVPEQYRSNQQQSFIDLLNGVEDPFRPTLRDGVALQRVLEALIRSSEQQRWVEVE